MATEQERLTVIYLQREIDRLGYLLQALAAGNNYLKTQEIECFERFRATLEAHHGRAAALVEARKT
jgi:hypothetical protein